MAVLRRNILANYAGQIWMALMGVVFAPLYIRILGMEAFGLVGLMLSVQMLSTLLDLGMGGSLNREISRRIHDPSRATSIRDLVRTLESLVWPITLVIALLVWLASDALAHHWLHPQRLSSAETAHAIAVMGLAVALVWPSSFYANGLSGLERQPTLNMINAAFATLRGAGVLAVLYWVSPTITAFMWWYAVMGAGQSLVSALLLWSRLPRADHTARFRRTEIHASGRFAGGLLLIGALSTSIMQFDRIVVSAMLPLSELGYFSLAISVASAMGRMIQPMFNALYPRYSRLVARHEQAALTELYHLSNQYLAIVVAAVSAVLIVFSRDVIYLWTGDADTAARVALPLSILTAGTACNGFMNLPYALQLAHGWTRLTIAINLAALLLGIPFCIWAVANYGIVGAAGLWFGVNLGFVTIGVPLMHRRLERGGLARWYLRDTLPPVMAAGVVATVARQFITTLPRDLGGLAALGAVSGVTLLAAALAAAPVRDLLRRRLRRA